MLALACLLIALILAHGQVYLHIIIKPLTIATAAKDFDYAWAASGEDGTDEREVSVSSIGSFLLSLLPYA